MPVTDLKPTSDNPQTQASQNFQYAAPYPQQFEDDTIDLYELWITLWNKKWLVIAVTATAALGSVVYARQQLPIYKAEALLLPPKAKDVQSLNVPSVFREVETGTQSILTRPLVGSVFLAFQKNLSSRSLQKKFIINYGLLNILAPHRFSETRDIEILEGFSKMIKIKSKGAFSVSTESDDPEFAAKLINDYISFFDLETVRGLVDSAWNSIEDQITDIEAIISSKRQMARLRREDQIQEVEYTITSKQKMAKQRRGDQILRLKEAIVIADSLGIRKRVDATSFIKVLK